MSENNCDNFTNPLSVSQGGSSNTTFTAYSVITAGTTPTGSFQNVSGLGSLGQVLTSTGSSSLPIWQTAGGGTGIITQSATTTLTSAQVKALHATPITILAAQGSGTIISVIGSLCELVYGGSNVFVAGASQSIQLAYTGASGYIFLLGMQNSSLVSNSSQINNTSNDSSGLTATAAQIENQLICVYNTIATEISGNAANDNTVKITIWYQVLTL